MGVSDCHALIWNRQDSISLWLNFNLLCKRCLGLCSTFTFNQTRQLVAICFADDAWDTPGTLYYCHHIQSYSFDFTYRKSLGSSWTGSWCLMTESKARVRNEVSQCRTKRSSRSISRKVFSWGMFSSCCSVNFIGGPATQKEGGFLLLWQLRMVFFYFLQTFVPCLPLYGLVPPNRNILEPTLTMACRRRAQGWIQSDQILSPISVDFVYNLVTKTPKSGHSTWTPVLGIFSSVQ